MRNPDWVRDEIILVMDLYLRAGRKQLPSAHGEVLRLSQLLNRLPIHPLSLRDENFRNPNGISMILGNFLGVDPYHDQPGLSKNNQLQASIWKEFIEAPSLLHRIADAIQASISVETSEVVIDDADVFPEGHLLTKQHILRERSQAAVVAKIDQTWRRDGRIACEACAFNFLDFYGEIGRGFAECHHVVPLAEAAVSRRTRLSDLALVCANCHRMLHRARPVLTLEDLKILIARRYQPQHGGTV